MPYPVIPDIPGPATTGDQTLQNAAAANGNGNALAVLGYGTVVFTISGTFGATVNFEGTEDGVNWTALKATQLGTDVIGVSTTTTGDFEASCAGLKQVRARVSGYASGAVTVTANGTALAAPERIVDVASIAGNLLAAPADNLALAQAMPTLQLGQAGTGIYVVERVANVIKNVPGTTITAGTPVSVWTPAAGKKFRILGYHLGTSVAASVIFKDGTSGAAPEAFRTAIQAANGAPPSPPLGNGYLSSAANNQLWLDVTATGAVHGFVVGVEE